MAKCLTPWYSKQENLDLPCGKCYECRQARISGWVFRCYKELERSTSAHFVTLTYETDSIPINLLGQKTLLKSDLQTFFKTLRKKNETKLKYYACGEYGDQSERPHYHLILFNAETETIYQSWKKGAIYIGESVTEASIAYTAKYITKNGKVPVNDNDKRLKEYSVMSKRLGDNYLTPQMIKWHKKDILNRMYLPTKGGGKLPLPRYYKDKIYTKHQKLMIAGYLEKKEAAEFNKLSSILQKYQETQNELIRWEKMRKNKDNRKKTL